MIWIKDAPAGAAKVLPRMRRHGAGTPPGGGHGRKRAGCLGCRRGPLMQPKTWLAIVDAEHARFVALDAGCFLTVQTLTSPIAGQRRSAIAGDRLGRTFESAGALRHAIAPRSDPRAPGRQRFAVQVAAELNAAAARELFARLILVAPARTLPAIEEALDPGVRRGIAARVAKNLTKTPDGDLAAHLPSWPSLPGLQPRRRQSR